MLIVKIITFSLFTLASRFDGGSDPQEFSRWVCNSQGIDDSKKINKTMGEVRQTESSAREKAYLKCRFAGYNDCEITTCHQIPNQF